MGFTDHKLALVGAGLGAGTLLYWRARASKPSVPGPEETGFGAYLRDLSVGVPTAPSQAGVGWGETSFEAYLRPDAFKAVQEGPGSAGSTEESEALPGTARPIAIVFGTEFGFSKEISERLATRLREAGEDYWSASLVWEGEGGGLGAHVGVGPRPGQYSAPAGISGRPGPCHGD